MTQAPETESCANCRFWDRSSEAFHKGQIGDCRRHAPRINDVILSRTQRQQTLRSGSDYEGEEMEADIYFASPFPISHEEQWCGEFQRAAHLGEA